MTINTVKQAKKLLFNKYESLDSLVFVKTSEYTFYKFIKGDILNVVGMVRYSDKEDVSILFIVNDEFDIQDLFLNEFIRFIGDQCEDNLKSTTAIAGRQLEVVKKIPH